MTLAARRGCITTLTKKLAFSLNGRIFIHPDELQMLSKLLEKDGKALN